MATPTEISSKNSVEFLSSAANNLPSSSPSSNILKSYYFTKCRTITLGSSFNLPQRFTKSTLRCPKCCVQYEDGDATYRIKPECKKSKFARKLLKKQEDDKDLTGYQRKYLKNLMHKGDAPAHNTLVIKCGVCKNEVKERLRKPKFTTVSVTPNEQTSVSSSLKKKKKKDRFSGLNKDAVLSVTSTPNKSFNTSDFIALEVTPNIESNCKKVTHKKRLFDKKQQNKIINKVDKAKDKKLKKNKQRKLKDLKNILNNSKQKSSPSLTLKRFLTSI